MSNNEIWAIAIGLALGYAIVSKLLNRNVKQQDAAGRSTGSSHEHDRQADEAGTHSQSTEGRDGERQSSASGDPIHQDWWDVLQVSPVASAEEIRKSYKSLMSRYHPDKVESLAPEFKELAERRTKLINAAYDEAMRLKT